jgi:hypothetical protein
MCHAEQCCTAPPLRTGTLTLGSVNYNAGINEHGNFHRFWMSLLTLLRVIGKNCNANSVIAAQDGSR